MLPLFKTLLTDLRTWLAIFIVVLIASGIYLYRENAYLTQQLQMTKGAAEQNETAWRDSLNKQAAEKTELVAFVRDLQTTTSRLRKEVVFWKMSYTNVIDSIHDNGVVLPVDGVDSTGKYTKVSFSGQQSIANYSGEVKVYLTPLSKATWLMDIKFAPIYTIAEFDRNKEGLFFIRTTSRTPGVNVIGYSILDSAAYPYLYKANNPLTEKPSYWLYGGGIFDSDNVTLGGAIKADPWLFLLNCRVFQRDPNPYWYNRVQIGIYHSIF